MGKIVKLPSQTSPNSRFHLIQTSIPVFVGGRTYEIPQGGKSLLEVAQANGLPVHHLISSTGKEKSYQFTAGEKLEIRQRGMNSARLFSF
jgi:hypothetical protein